MGHSSDLLLSAGSASPFGAAGAARLYEAAIEAALAAHRAGTFDELAQRRPRLTRWLLRRVRSALIGSGGDAFAGEQALPRAAAVLLQWAVAQLRPDRELLHADIAREAWLHKTGWRPMLAVLGYGGFMPIPDYRDHYRRRPDEAPVDNLCGLWGVGPSTFYRYLERAKQSIAALVVEAPANPVRLLSLRRTAGAAAHRLLGLDAPAAQAAWHAKQMVTMRERGDPLSALWHGLHAGDAAGCVALLAGHVAQLARATETDALLERLAARQLEPRAAFDLQLARAALHRQRDAPERELQAYEVALRVATQRDDRLLLGIVYGALGKFHEARDADRAFACYEESAAFLRDAPADEAARHYRVTLVRLGWLYVLRNDPRSKTVLELAGSLHAGTAVPGDTAGMLEQAWGEYWRRAGDLQQAIAHKHRALALFEREGDLHSVLKTYANLSLIYGEAKDFERALDYGQRVLSLGTRIEIGPEMRASARLNLGATHFWLGQYDEAIAQYRAALDESLGAELKLHVNRAHYNLAEAYYKRFALNADPQDERLGDTHAAASMRARPSESSQLLIEATRNLKAEVLGAQVTQATDRLLPEESAVHFEEMADIARHRAVLAVPVAVEAHVRARLEIANTYLAIAAKEREAALELARRHGLDANLGPVFDRLRRTYDSQRSREQQLAEVWAQRAGDLLDAQRRGAVLMFLLRDGAINKSSFAGLCAVSPATASKHLALLTGRGLLEQTGKGPSTRYRLPD